MWWLCVVTLVAMGTGSRSQALKVKATFRGMVGSADRMEAMDVDMETGTIIVAGSGGVSVLDPDMNLVTMVTSSDLGNMSDISGVLVNSKLNTVTLCSRKQEKCHVRDRSNLKTLISTGSDLIQKENNNRNLILLRGSNPKQLFIVSDFINDVTIPSNVPILSSRFSDNLHLVEKSSAMFLQNPKRLPKSYFVKYLSAFIDQSYVYFISQQSDVTGSKIVTKMSRICESDDKFRSYVEIQLKCGFSSQDQEHSSAAQSASFEAKSGRLYVAFSSGTQQSARQTAICGYDLRDVNKMMDEAVYDCAVGRGMLGPAHFHPPAPCPYLKVTTGITDPVLIFWVGTVQINFSLCPYASMGSATSHFLNASVFLNFKFTRALSGLKIVSSLNFT